MVGGGPGPRSATWQHRQPGTDTPHQPGWYRESRAATPKALRRMDASAIGTFAGQHRRVRSPVLASSCWLAGARVAAACSGFPVAIPLQKSSAPRKCVSFDAHAPPCYVSPRRPPGDGCHEGPRPGAFTGGPRRPTPTAVTTSRTAPTHRGAIKERQKGGVVRCRTRAHRGSTAPPEDL